MIKTKDLFTFELELGSDTEQPTGQRLEDLLYNCLDFCLLYRKQAHFFLTGPDAARHPELRRVLELLREEGASFSLLIEPERGEYEALRSKTLWDKGWSKADGEATCELGALIAGLCIALVSTVSIATIAASINAGGLGSILFDGLRTMNVAKILWGSILSALLAILIDQLLTLMERKSKEGA